MYNKYKIYTIILIFLYIIGIIIYCISIYKYKKMEEKLIDTRREYIKIMKENTLMKIRENIIQNSIKDELLQKKIDENMLDVTDAIKFFYESTDTTILQR